MKDFKRNVEKFQHQPSKKLFLSFLFPQISMERKKTSLFPLTIADVFYNPQKYRFSQVTLTSFPNVRDGFRTIDYTLRHVVLFSLNTNCIKISFSNN